MLNNKNTIDEIIANSKAFIIELCKKQKFDEAEKEALELLSYNPFDDQSLYMLAKIKQAKGETEVSKFLLNKAIAADAYNPLFWAELGIMAIEQNYFPEALRLFEKSIELNNKYAIAYKGIASIYFTIKELDKAKEYYLKVLELLPNDDESKHMINSIDGNKSVVAPKVYIEGLFDKYAEKFESHLVERLEYKTPKIIVDKIAELCDKSKFENKLLDLGCGTGLIGVEIKNHNLNNFHLIGVDLSSKMIEEAKKKNVYNKLTATDIVSYFNKYKKLYDYIIAADVFVYVGDLEEIIHRSYNSLNTNGYMIFSVEQCQNENEDFELIAHSGRYSHSKHYIEKLAEENNFNIVSIEETELRKELGNYIKGYVVVLKK